MDWKVIFSLPSVDVDLAGDGVGFGVVFAFLVVVGVESIAGRFIVLLRAAIHSRSSSLKYMGLARWGSGHRYSKGGGQLPISLSIALAVVRDLRKK